MILMYIIMVLIGSVVDLAISAKCERDSDCPSNLICIEEKCLNPCKISSPCHSSTQCHVWHQHPAKPMICTCLKGWTPVNNAKCHAFVLQIPPRCLSNTDCRTNEACMNRICKNPCECGSHATCMVKNHIPTCLCGKGLEGNPYSQCMGISCTENTQCGLDKACIKGNCANPCMIKNPCGVNAECFMVQNKALCKCAMGYKGNPQKKCESVKCSSNSDCPTDKQCRDSDCIDPCINGKACASKADCKVLNHIASCVCRSGFSGDAFIKCKPECNKDQDCSSGLACLGNICQDPCLVLKPCQELSKCVVMDSVPVRTILCICPLTHLISGNGMCHPVERMKPCASDDQCPADEACTKKICKNTCSCGANSQCRLINHKPVCTGK